MPTTLRTAPRAPRWPPGQRPSSSACTGTTVGSAARWPPDRSGSPQSGCVRPKCLHRFPDPLLQVLEPRAVRVSLGSHQHVHRQAPALRLREDEPSSYLPDPPLQPVPLNDAPPVLRDDDTQPGKRNGGRREEDVYQPRPLALPPLKDCADLIGVADADPSRETFTRSGRRSVYLLPTTTARRARPFFRRRERVARPPRVFILARNPCLLTRLRLRGLYVGFIRDSPIHGSFFVSKRAWEDSDAWRQASTPPVASHVESRRYVAFPSTELTFPHPLH